MGFRNLQAFNLALLAKQGWQILSNPNSLLAKVYKAKYFSYDDILNAKLGSNPSHAWRSIFNSLAVIRKGTRWRVGNGKRIHIWEDKWLPTRTTHKVISFSRDFGDFPMVSSLIDENSKWWKPDLVKALFLQFKANEILKIPLSYSLPKDSLIWLGNRKGSFSVKSAYYVAKDLVESEAAGASSSSHLASPFWRKIWQEFKQFAIKRLSKQISLLIISVNELKSESTIFNKLPNEVVSNLYIFCLRMLNRILRDVNGTSIVTIDGKMFLMNTIINEKFLHPQKLGATTTDSDVFCLSSR
ncbi:uncharacterized protein LOC136064721 [Quercus suber]|uniref:uncharacterized protein LOC136064721 n=1 Tax=Quercus suber TaxID=58331 RepID=UPI0032DE5739